MEVCEICGAFLVVGDAKQRLAEHLIGKQHMGYAQVRATVESLKVGNSHMAAPCMAANYCPSTNHNPTSIGRHVTPFMLMSYRGSKFHTLGGENENHSAFFKK